MRHYNYHRLCIRVTEVLATNLYRLTKRDLNAFALFSMHSIFAIDKNMKQMRNVASHIPNSKPAKKPLTQCVLSKNAKYAWILIIAKIQTIYH